MLTREAFEHEIRRFEKEICNELTDKSKETLWNFFSMQTVKFMKETLARCLENVEDFKMALKNGDDLPVSKPKDIQALFNVMDAMHTEMMRQNDIWYKLSIKNNYRWLLIYCMLFALHMWTLL